MMSIKEVSVTNIVDIYLGGVPKTSIKEYWDGDILWAITKDVANCESKYVEKTEKKITQEGIENSAAKILPKDTILITYRGTVGKICMFPFPMSFNQTCYGLVAKRGVNPLYLFYKLKSLVTQINKLSYETVFDTITKKTFDDLVFTLPSERVQRTIAPILGTLHDNFGARQSELRKVEVLRPPLSIQKEAAKPLENCMMKISRNEDEIYILAVIRDTILPKLMSGAVRVKIPAEVKNARS